MARRDGRDLDAEARKLGYADRKEREAVRRAVKAGKVTDTRYKPQAPGTPGGRGRRAPTLPENRTRGKWHPLGKQGGRVKSTGSASVAQSALKGAARKGEKVYVSALADVVATESEDRRTGQAGTGLVDPQDILAAIEAAGGDVKAGMAAFLETMPMVSHVEGIREFTIRAYPQ